MRMMLGFATWDWPISTRQPAAWKFLDRQQKHHETRSQVVGVFVGDEILRSYRGIIINHDKDPVINQPVQWKVGGCFLWLR